MSWDVVVPVKDLGVAKSRLRRDRGGVSELALAFALDTVSAVQDSREAGTIIIVSNDMRVRAAAKGILFVDDPGLGLNGAVSAGLRAAGTGRVAVLTADLPGIKPEDLDRVLRDAGRYERAMVADHSGRGTTMLTSSGASVDPQFGGGSRWRHERQGHVVLPVPLASALRWDIDTAEDLEIVLRGRVGRETARILAAQQAAPVSSGQGLGTG